MTNYHPRIEPITWDNVHVDLVGSFTVTDYKGNDRILNTVTFVAQLLAHLSWLKYLTGHVPEAVRYSTILGCHTVQDLESLYWQLK